MEKTTNQIPQTPIIESNYIPPKPKTNYLNLFLISFCFVVFIVGAYYLGRQSMNTSEISTFDPKLSPTIIPTIVARPSSEPVTNLQVSTSTPKSDSKEGIVSTYSVTGGFSDQTSGIKIAFPGKMYVEKTSEAGYNLSKLRYGRYRLSDSTNFEQSSIQIDYGKPYLDGKGGACVDWNGNSLESIITLDKVDTALCKTTTEKSPYHIYYPSNPNRKIEYSIFIGGTSAEKDKYLELLKTGLIWLK